MKKTLLALAVLGAFGAAHASDVTVYGKFNPSYDFMKIKDATAAGDIKTTSMSNNASRIGFKGTEDLGGGSKAIFQMESNYDMVDKGGFGGGARDSFVGITGGWGTFKVGAFDEVYKSISASYDPFGDSISDYNSIMGMTGATLNSSHKSPFTLNERYKQVMEYSTPKMSGFQAMVGYSWNKTDDDSAAGSTESKMLDIGATYNNGPLNVLAAYVVRKSETTGTTAEDIKGYKIGASYALPTKTKLSGIYEGIKQDGVTDTKHIFVGVQHPINNIDLLANFIWADDNDELGDNTGAKVYNLGVRYNFSKRTNIMGMYTMLNNDDAGTYYVDGYGSHSAIPGAEVSGFSVRMQHSF